MYNLQVFTADSNHTCLVQMWQKMPIRFVYFNYSINHPYSTMDVLDFNNINANVHGKPLFGSYTSTIPTIPPPHTHTPPGDMLHLGIYINFKHLFPGSHCFILRIRGLFMGSNVRPSTVLRWFVMHKKTKL